MSEISKTADKALDILEALADGRFTTPQQVAARTDVNRTVVHRLLTTLHARGFLAKSGGEYALTPQVSRIASAVEPDLRFASKSVLDMLSSKYNETVLLHVVDGDEVVVLVEDVPASAFALQVRHEVGVRSRMTSSASGLAILAELAEPARERVLADVSERTTLLERLADIREAGFAITNGELQEGVSGIAVPVFRAGSVVASVTIIVPTARGGDLTRYAQELQRQSKRISNLLG